MRSRDEVVGACEGGTSALCEHLSAVSRHGQPGMVCAGSVWPLSAVSTIRLACSARDASNIHHNVILT